MEFAEVVRRRGMVRAFLSRPVEEATVRRLLEYAHRAPSAGFTQPVEFVVVRDPAVRQRLVQAAWGQTWVGAAPVVLAVCADTRRSAARYGERGVRRYSIVDAAFASMLILLGAVDEGLGACFVGAFDDDAVRDVLGLPPHVLPVGLIPVGYPAERPPRYRRRPLESLVHHDRW
ncbi:MAG: nitroreductase family protein [Armatimonadota bacterium]|nr:nitroreductase family protein [Armatimonadota bacterium]MDR7437081.1 nitroreductase family protein [Armatimonadota bacterium]MDR7472426.1 nitroreductase family protein [Armatimonadota bacterium]MDR7506669.1 nitroreductase family protein [Armatimonadota bacterium]MDR7509227.1 nitroreductase family protein [Armatimonadota bacterium]